MNKTVNINLGGLFFHIDEDAYQKLSRYFDAIKRSLSNSSGQDEIIRDIEMRIAELVSERHLSDKQVISLKELDEIIAIMGQPEDYRLEDEAVNYDQPPGFDTRRRSRKLYRDTEKGMIGGVATGLGHYLGIDSVWLKIMFLLFVVFGFGSGIIAYIVLWIVTPAALTTSEKLEMTGEPVTISNIEKKVREEFDNMSQRFKDTDFNKTGNYVKSGAGRAAAGIGNAFLTILTIFAKLLGAFIVVLSAVMLGSMIIGIFTLGSTSIINMPGQQYIEALNYTDQPLWLIGLLALGAFGIPIFALFILGLKLLITNMKSIGNVAKYTLLALWIISVAGLTSLGIKQATEIAFDGKIISKQTIALQPTDTLQIKFTHSDHFSNDINDYHEYMFTEDVDGKDVIFSTDVEFHVLKTDQKQPYIQIEKLAEGRSQFEAKKRAEKILYNFAIDGNQLIFDNYLLTDSENKYRNQSVKIFLYLPEGTVLKPDSSIQRYDDSDDDFFNLHYSGDYIYKVQNQKVVCVDCPVNENEYGDVMGSEQDSITTSVKVKVKVAGVEVLKKETTSKRPIQQETLSKGLRFDENGVIIKNE